MTYKKTIIAGLVTLAFVAATSTIVAQKPEVTPVSEAIGWNANRTNIKDREFRDDYTAGWDNYFDGSWKKIDLTISEDGSGFHVTKAPYEFHAPKTSGGKFRYVSNTKFVVEDKKFTNDAPLEKTKEFPDALNVPGVVTAEGILYAGAFPSINGDLLIQVTPTAAKYLVKINSQPSGVSDVEINFKQGLSENLAIKRGRSAVTISGTGANIGNGVRVERGDRKLIVRPTYVWDSSVPPKQTQINTIGFFNGKKIVPRSFLASAQYPVYTDTVDTFTASANDRGITSDNASFATYRAGSTLTLETENNTSLYAVNWHPSTYVGYRSYVWWDTSSLPDTAVMSAGSVTVNYPGAHAAFSRVTYMVENRQASTTLATTDWTLIGASGVGTGTDEPYASITRTSGEAAGDKVFTINSTGLTKVSRTGNTFFTFISAYDWDNSAPPNEDTAGSAFKSSDNAANKPTLSITYTLPSPPKGVIIIRAIEKMLHIPFAYANGL